MNSHSLDRSRTCSPRGLPGIPLLGLLPLLRPGPPHSSTDRPPSVKHPQQPPPQRPTSPPLRLTKSELCSSPSLLHGCRGGTSSSSSSGATAGRSRHRRRQTRCQSRRKRRPSRERRRRCWSVEGEGRRTRGRRRTVEREGRRPWTTTWTVPVTEERASMTSRDGSGEEGE